MEDVIDFVVWITKNDRKKVQELYLSYLNEKIEENKNSNHEDDEDIYDAVISFRIGKELERKLSEAKLSFSK